MWLLDNRDFTLVWWAGLISVMGDWALRVALPVYVYEATGSPLATGLLVLSGTLPRILFGSLAGVFVDRWDHRRTMIGANALLALTLLPLLTVQGADLLWLAYPVAFVQATLSLFFGPAENALLPRLVPEAMLTRANALNALNNNLGRLLGPAAGGLVMGSFGLGAVVVLDAATFGASALLLALVRVRGGAGAAAAKPGNWLGEWRAGLGFVWRQPALRTLFAIVGLSAIGEGVMSTLFVPFVSEVLGGEAVQVGWLMSAQAVGGIVGGAVMSQVAGRFSPAKLLGWGALLLGLVDLAIFNYWALSPELWPALALFALAGLPVAAFGAGLLTLLQTGAGAHYRGRVFGAYTASSALLSAAGMAGAAYAGESLGAWPLINVQAAAYALAGLGALALLRTPGVTGAQASSDASEPSS